ncbi:MAG TPA: IS110 family transposase [Candidatus Tectomicrobia bacterium]
MRKLRRRQHARSAQGEARPFAGMHKVTAHAAGVDIGAHEIVACGPDGEEQQIVRTFGTYTADLQNLAAWFVHHGIETVAMESTGVSWIPLFEELEAHGLRCCLMSARSIKRVPGRKSDVVDCQWIQTLHSYGLLAASFRPEADLVALRTLLRHRAQLLEHRAPHILHMQKALWQMNIQLSQALSDVTGTTGLQIIRAIVAGERAPQRLAALRNYRCKKDAEEIARALTGTGRAEHLFVLTHALALFDFYTVQLQACDAQIDSTFSVIPPRFELSPEDTASAEVPAPPPSKPDSHSKNAPAVDTRAHILRITGVDLVAVHGISASLAQTIIAEIGTDMRKWEDEKHFCSWLGLAPQNDISGGKVLKSRTLKNRNRATQAFRMAAQSVSRSHCAFGAFSRRMQGRLGPAQALVATAHKIARTVYCMLKNRVPYHDIGAAEYNQRFREREIHYLQKKAAKLGYTLSPV